MKNKSESGKPPANIPKQTQSSVTHQKVSLNELPNSSSVISQEKSVDFEREPEQERPIQNQQAFINNGDAIMTSADLTNKDKLRLLKYRFGKEHGLKQFKTLDKMDTRLRDAVTINVTMGLDESELRIYSKGRLVKQLKGFQIYNIKWRAAEGEEGIYFFQATIDGRVVVNRLQI